MDRPLGRVVPGQENHRTEQRSVPPPSHPHPTQGLITSRCFSGKSGASVQGPTQTCSLGSARLLPAPRASLLPEWGPLSQPDSKASLFIPTCE